MLGFLVALAILLGLVFVLVLEMGLLLLRDLLELDYVLCLSSGLVLVPGLSFLLKTNLVMGPRLFLVLDSVLDLHPLLQLGRVLRPPCVRKMEQESVPRTLLLLLLRRNPLVPADS